jgi:hypothetical protein
MDPSSARWDHKAKLTRGKQVARIHTNMEALYATASAIPKRHMAAATRGVM